MDVYMNMKYALEEAKKAFLEDEVPVGAIIVLDDKIIARGHNTKVKDKSISSHAEINSINSAFNLGYKYNLNKAAIFITLEPCPMCLYAIINSGIKIIYFGAYETNSGACESYMKVNMFPSGDNIKIIGGIMEDPCGEILVDFFENKRLMKLKVKERGNYEQNK